jgi:hypothetical protein
MTVRIAPKLAVTAVVAAAGLVAMTGGVAVSIASPGHVAKTTYSAANLLGASLVPHSTTAWAVGFHVSGETKTPYAVRRTGSHWSAVTAASAPTGELVGVDAVSAKLIWAVGDFFATHGQTPLIERSKGGSFSRLKVKTGGGKLYAVSASSKSNAWAVGGSNSSRPLALHWNGKAWKTVKVNGNVADTILTSVTTVSAKDAWAVGSRDSVAVFANWNGHVWKISSAGAPIEASLSSIAAASAKDVWAVGDDFEGAGGGMATLIYHFNGTTWAPFTSPSPMPQSDLLSVAVAGSRVFAVGYGSPKSALRNAPIAMRFSGGAWHVESAATGGKHTQLAAVAVSAKSQAAVGTSNGANVNASPGQPLAENLVGTSWRKVPVPK